MLIDTSPALEPHGPKTAGRYAVFPEGRERIVSRVLPPLAHRIKAGAAHSNLSVSEFSARLMTAALDVWEADMAQQEEEPPMRGTG